MDKTPPLLIVATLAMLCTSCVTSRRVNYLQDMTPGSQIELEHRFEARIAPYDELTITVTSALSSQEMATPFNNPDKSAKDNTYLVDVDGNIEFPVLGKIHIAGLTRLLLQDTLTDMLARGGYLDAPFVTARFNNFKVFYLGNGTGKVINIPNERCTFLEALAMIGGLDNYTRRDRIAVMREVDGQMTMRYLDPRSSDIFNDPFFMLQQNDFIITDGVNAGTYRSEMNFWVGVFSTALSIANFIGIIFISRKQ